MATIVFRMGSLCQRKRLPRGVGGEQLLARDADMHPVVLSVDRSGVGLKPGSIPIRPTKENQTYGSKLGQIAPGDADGDREGGPA